MSYEDYLEDLEPAFAAMDETVGDMFAEIHQTLDGIMARRK